MAPNHKRFARQRAAAPPHSEMASDQRWIRFLQWERLNWWVAFIPGVFGAALLAVAEIGLAEVSFGITALFLAATIVTRRGLLLAKFWMLIGNGILFGLLILQLDFDRVEQARKANEDSLRLPYGELSPANEKFTGHDFCPPDVQAKYPFALHLGSLTARFSSLPHVVVTLGGKAILAADKSKDGTLGISVEVFDDHRTILASIEDNDYSVAQSVFRKEQRDFHGFKLFDMHNEMILNVRLLNSKEAYITGSLFYRVGAKVTDDALLLEHGNVFAGGCTFGVGGVDYSIN